MTPDELKIKMVSDTFLDFALYILHAKPAQEFDRLTGEWEAAVDVNAAVPPTRAKRVQEFAKNEGFSFSINQCEKALDFWDSYHTAQGGPVTY